jgi:hypothetical protein
LRRRIDCKEALNEIDRDATFLGKGSSYDRKRIYE